MRAFSSKWFPLALLPVFIGCGGASDDSLFRGAGAGGSADSDSGGGVGGGAGTGAGGRSPFGGSAGTVGAGGTGAPADGGTGGARADGAAGTAPIADGSTPTTDGGTPESVLCAGDPCAIPGVPRNVCCIATPPFPTSCFPEFPGCFPVAGFPIACDDRADCTDGRICCGRFGPTSPGAQCAENCGSFTHQLCRTDAECTQGTCVPTPAARGYSTCQ